jgi:hypothetical protein
LLLQNFYANFAMNIHDQTIEARLQRVVSEVLKVVSSEKVPAAYEEIKRLLNDKFLHNKDLLSHSSFLQMLPQNFGMIPPVVAAHH